MFCHLLALSANSHYYYWVSIATKQMHCTGTFQPSAVLTNTDSNHGQPGKNQPLNHSLTHSLSHKCLFYRVTLLPLLLFNDAVTCIKITDTAKYIEYCTAVRVAYGTGTGGGSRCERNCGIAECIYNTISLAIYHKMLSLTIYH